MTISGTILASTVVAISRKADESRDGGIELEVVGDETEVEGGDGDPLFFFGGWLSALGVDEITGFELCIMTACKL